MRKWNINKISERWWISTEKPLNLHWYPVTTSRRSLTLQKTQHLFIIIILLLNCNIFFSMAFPKDRAIYTLHTTISVCSFSFLIFHCAASIDSFQFFYKSFIEYSTKTMILWIIRKTESTFKLRYWTCVRYVLKLNSRICKQRRIRMKTITARKSKEKEWK